MNRKTWFLVALAALTAVDASARTVFRNCPAHLVRDKDGMCVRPGKATAATAPPAAKPPPAKGPQAPQRGSNVTGTSAKDSQKAVDMGLDAVQGGHNTGVPTMPGEKPIPSGQ